MIPLFYFLVHLCSLSTRSLSLFSFFLPSPSPSPPWLTSSETSLWAIPRESPLLRRRLRRLLLLQSALSLSLPIFLLHLANLLLNSPIPISVSPLSRSSSPPVGLLQASISRMFLLPIHMQTLLLITTLRALLDCSDLSLLPLLLRLKRHWALNLLVLALRRVLAPPPVKESLSVL